MGGVAAAKVLEQRHQVRRLIPARYLPVVVRRRLDRFWELPEFRRTAEAQMHHLLEFTERADEAPDLAYGYAEQMMLRSYLRWHPRAVCRQRVEGVEWLTTRRDQGRGVLLSFMHHAHYIGIFSSLHRLGVDLTLVLSPVVLGSGTAVELRQHGWVMGHDVDVIPSDAGTEQIVDALRPGTVLALASDVPSRTPVTFLGRRVRGAFGAARIAHMTDSPVVVVTTHRDRSGPHLQVDPPLDPRDFAGPQELLDAMLARHGEAVLAWPEAFDVPRARFAPLEDDEP